MSSAAPNPCRARAASSQAQQRVRRHRPNEASRKGEQSDLKKAAAAEMITERPAQKDERTQGQQVGVDRPGQIRGSDPEVRRQCGGARH